MAMNETCGENPREARPVVDGRPVPLWLLEKDTWLPKWLLDPTEETR